MKEKYENVEMEVIEFEGEDIVTISGPITEEIDEDD